MVADSVPLYALYALLFTDAGLSVAEISLLFAIWSLTSVVAEVPSGALADRFSRRGALVAGGVLQAVGYALWIGLPGFAAFAAGFVLWGLGGALTSGAFEALLYDGLDVAGAPEAYARVQGRVTGAGLLAQVPAAVGATVLFPLGGYGLVGAASIVTCLTAAGLAWRLPDVRPVTDPVPRDGGAGDDGDGDDGDDGLGYVATLRAGVAEVVRLPAVRIAVVAVALVTGIDAIDEYFPLLTADLGVPVTLVPLAGLVVVVAGAAGAALGGAAARWRPAVVGLLLATSALALGVVGLVRQPVGLVGVAVFYGLYRTVLIVTETRLQERIEGAARATITSVAAFCTEFSALLLYAAWALGEVVLVAALVLVVAVVLPRGLRSEAPTTDDGCRPGG